MVGRMVHVGVVIPQIHHFMSRLRGAMRRASSRRSIKLNQLVKDDLKLMMFFLERANAGIDMNILVHRKPTKVYRSDSCPAGMGGYSSDGFAWRWYIPAHLRFRASNNFLEHIATTITPWVDILAKRLKPGDCSLSMGDSTISEGWLRKSNFREEGEDEIQATARLEVCREDAARKLKNEIRDYGQWFAGKYNWVSDALSRDDDRTDEELINVFRTFCPSQIPDHFEIVPLPNEIVSWLTSLLQRLPVKEQLREKHTRTRLGRCPDGSNTASPSESKGMSSSIFSREASGLSSWEHLPWLSVKGDFLHNVMGPWLKTQSEVPSHMLLRPSGKMTEEIQRETKTASLADFYLGCTAASKIRTPTRSSKKPSPSRS